MKKQKHYTTGQLGQLFKVAPRTIAKWFDTGKLKGWRVPGTQDRRIPHAEVERFAKEYGFPLEWDDDAIDLRPTAGEVARAAERGLITPEEAEAVRPGDFGGRPKALADYLDTDAIDGFLIEACDRYEMTAPTVCDHCNGLYVRLAEEPEKVSVFELVRVLGLREGGVWEQPNHAANRVYKLRHRLGLDTTGHLGCRGGERCVSS